MFHGPWVGLLPTSVLATICLFMMTSRAGLDWYVAILLSILPFLGVTVFVLIFVNGKPDSYFFDLIAVTAWRFKRRLYLAGLLDNPPLFWMAAPLAKHPSEFN